MSRARWLLWPVALVIGLLLGSFRADAVTGSFYAETRYGTRFICQSARQNLVNCTSSNPCTYVDCNTPPQLHYFDGTTDTTITQRATVSQSVASLGASTTIATLAPPTSGIYRVSVIVSAHTNNDTISVTIAYTEADMATAITLAPITSLTLTHDTNTGHVSVTSVIRASTATNIVCTLSASTQTTTHASCVIERLN